MRIIDRITGSCCFKNVQVPFDLKEPHARSDSKNRRRGAKISTPDKPGC